MGKFTGFLCLIAVAFALCACSLFKSTTTTSAGTTVTLTPLGGAVCAIESSAAGGIAGSVAGALACSNQAAIVASLEAALGNANLCGASLPAAAPAVAGLKAMAVLPQWKTLGDVPASALVKTAVSGQMKAQAVKAMGLVGGIACPIVINTAIGFLSNSVPAAWGCTTSTTIVTVQGALTAACEAAVPI